MPGKSDMNVSLGLIAKQFEKGIRDANKRLLKFQRQAERIGTTITQNFSLPLGLAGAGAISAAADVERLSLALTAVTKETGPLSDQLDRLRKIAESPSLGFEQAIAASTRLQAVNLSAREAERTIEAFGNAVARSGGGTEDFDGTIRALTQIASKGKVFAEEINQINERVFEIRPAMEAAFGTSVAKDIEKLGISSEEFIARITDEFTKLPKVTGGLANSLENAQISVKLFAAEVGNIINETFDVQKGIDGFSNSLNNLATFVRRLDPELRKVVLRTAGLVAISGPAILAVSTTAKIMRGLLPAANVAVAGFKVLSAGYIRLIDLKNNLVPTITAIRKGNLSLSEGFTKLAPRISKAAKAFAAFNVATKLSIIGGAVIAVTALAAAYNAFQKRVERANAVNKTFRDIQSQSARAIAEEKSNVDRLISAARDENRSKQQRIAALERLQRISPTYFSNLTIEENNLKSLTDRQKAYNDELIKQAKIKAAEQTLIDIQKQLLDITTRVEEAQPDFFQSAANAALSFGNATVFAARQIKTSTKNTIENEKALKRQEKALLDFLDANQRVENLGGGGPQNFIRRATSDDDGYTIPLRVSTEGFESTIEVIKDFDAILQERFSKNQLKPINTDFLSPVQGFLKDFGVQLDLVGAKAQAFSTGPGELLQQKINLTASALERAVEGFGLNSEVVINLQNKLAGLEEEYDKFNRDLEITSAFAGLIGPAFDQFFDAVGSGSKNAFAEFGKGIKDMIKQLALAVAKAAALAAVLTTFGALTGIPIGKINTAIGGAEGGSLFGSILRNFTGFAKGGIAFGPTASIIGEAGPEIVQRLDEPINPFSNMELKATLKGEDILLSVERAQFRQNRRA